MAAARIVDGVLVQSRTLDETLDAVLADFVLEPRDRAFARLLATTVLRRLGELEAVLMGHLQKAPRQGLAWPVLLIGAAQLLLLETPAHAAISLAVDQVRSDRRSEHLTGLVNAVLRKVASDGGARLAGLDAASLDVPEWLLRRWVAAYGAETAREIARMSLTEAALDISVKSDSEGWATRLGGIVLPTGTVRLQSKGAVEELEGFDEGEWWVQDAAAALPARLFGVVDGLTIADLCAAPGGKTAELVNAGAKVTAVDASAARATRLRANLARLRQNAEVVIADVADWQPGTAFDAVLLDAPCSATGTIRRHPDILRLKRPGDIARLAEQQARLLSASAEFVRPGGTLVYCTCSLEPEEGPEQIERFLSSNPQFRRVRVEPAEIGGCGEMITPDGDLRTLPCHLPNEISSLSGLDGFYAARLRRVT